MRPILLFGEKRLPAFKDVPSSYELGYKVALPQFRAIVVRAGTQPDIVKKLSQSLQKVYETPEYKKFLEEQFGDPNSFEDASKAPAFVDEQLNDMVCYQEEVRDPSRIAEVLNRVITKAKRLSAPAQINVPRDYWTQVIDINLPAIVDFERPAGGAQAITQAAKLLSEAKFPVILSGAGVVLANAIPDCAALAEKLDAPVCNNYQHNDSFPGSHPLAVGPLGYNGSKAAMEIVAKADVVLALGTRLNPFSTLPGYGIDYWPKTAKIIQVDINPDRIGLTKPVAVGICGDAKSVAQSLLKQLAPSAGNAGRAERKALIHQTKSHWLQTLSSMEDAIQAAVKAAQ